MFQSRPGFSPCFDIHRSNRTSTRPDVSIPSWVFSLLRLSTHPQATPRKTRFNPVLGFLPASTRMARRRRRQVAIVSIPSWVFSLLRPECVVSRERVGKVSIPSWVFSLLRHRPYQYMSNYPFVSIPSWVFSLLRRHRGGRIRGRSPGFNPVLGFLPASTPATPLHHDAREQFQSRPGFSPCFDVMAHSNRPGCLFVSIPSWVFSLLRPCDSVSTPYNRIRFQSRPGFSPCFDVVRVRDVFGDDVVSIPSWVFSLLRLVVRSFSCGLVVVFQSRPGFSPCFDARSRQRLGADRRVSIPSWVFSLLRPDRPRTVTRPIIVSIPSWVFSLLRPGDASDRPP